MSMMKEFKEFAMRGSVVDMAIGIVIGAAFGTIVKSFVADILSPPLGLLLGGMDLSAMFIVLKESVGETPAVTVNFGTFLMTIIDFIIIAWAIFMVIRGMNRMKRKPVEEVVADPPPPPPQEVLLSEIRDLLKEQKK